MKDYRQIADTVFKKRDEYLEKQKIRRYKTRTAVSVCSALCVFAVCIFFSKNDKPVLETVNSNTEYSALQDETVTHMITNINSEKYSRTIKKATEPTSQATVSETAETLITVSENNEPDIENGNMPVLTVTDIVTDISSGTVPVSQKITVSITDATTAETSEYYEIPKWDEKEIYEKFTEISFDGSVYCTRTKEISADCVNEYITSITAKGYDIYTDKIFSINAEVFSIYDISSGCAVAVKFETNDKYFVYTNREYIPSTLGEMLDLLNGENTISFGTLLCNKKDGNCTEIYDKVLLEELIYKNKESAMTEDFEPDVVYTVAISIDLLGIKNKSFGISADGYITTNIMEQRYTFFVGEEQVDAFFETVRFENEVTDFTGSEIGIPE